MLVDARNCMLLVVDMQERLLPAMAGEERALANTQLLIRAAREVQVPVLVSEQYPRGLGETVPALSVLVPPSDRMAKMEFSCYDNAGIRDRIDQGGRKQIIVCGIEAHVCVLQTAFGLSSSGYEVFVVADAVSSRTPQNCDLALRRMASAAIQVASAEMICFEWLRTAESPAFKAISKLVR